MCVVVVPYFLKLWRKKAYFLMDRTPSPPLVFHPNAPAPSLAYRLSLPSLNDHVFVALSRDSCFSPHLLLQGVVGPLVEAYERELRKREYMLWKRLKLRIPLIPTYKETAAIVGKTMMRSMRKGLHAVLQEQRVVLLHSSYAKGVRLLDVCEKVQVLSMVDNLVLFLCGLDYQEDGAESELDKHVETLTELCAQKARRVCTFIEAFGSTEEAKPEHTQKMQRVQRRLREAGVYVCDMEGFYKEPWQVRFHSTKAGMERALERFAGWLEKGRPLPVEIKRKAEKTQAIYKGVIWQEARVVLVREGVRFFPMCPWCDKRASASHLQSRVCKGPLTMKTYTRYWGVRAWESAPEHMTLESYDAHVQEDLALEIKHIFLSTHGFFC